jgi:hypothetical protein
MDYEYNEMSYTDDGVEHEQRGGEELLPAAIVNQKVRIGSESFCDCS